ncbi:glycosyltransferase [Natrinema sp. CBA1119]|uniref:glycosyltransferase n=1 Tax=Natrinema sp. CBA1119 TaxID=1608465 RepID=UPI00159BD151|nr:glycosyltransferase [Natrinema sp. CBA1119]
MGKSLKFSVILPTYNGELYVEEAIRSILKQTHSNFELIIVDDASEDNTPDIIDKYCDLECIKIFKNDSNHGLATTTNKAVDKSTGDVLAFIDQDDRWHDNKLEKHKYYHNREDRMVVFSDYKTIDADGDTIKNESGPIPASTRSKLIQQFCEFGNIIGTMSCATVPKSAWDSIGGFDKDFVVSADIDLWIRLSNLYDFRKINENLTDRRIHDNNTINNYRQMYIDNVKISDKLSGHRYISGKNIDQFKYRITKRRAYNEFRDHNHLYSLYYCMMCYKYMWKPIPLAIILCVVLNIITFHYRFGDIIENKYRSLNYSYNTII